MDLLFGFFSIFLLIPFTVFLIKLMEYIQKEYWLMIVPLMLFGDGILTFIWIYGFLDSIQSSKMFVIGLGISFFINMIVKILLTLKFQKENQI